MAFLGPDDILVSEKNQGTVSTVLGGQNIRGAVIGC
jgi:hypothetical protein